MSIFERLSKPKPKEETYTPKRRGITPEEIASEKTERDEAARKEREFQSKYDQANREHELQEAKTKFVTEKPKLERRLAEITSEIENYRRGLEEMKGPEMRKILDKEFELNSKQSPIDSTDPDRAGEYEMWVNALEDSREATQYLKADLGRRIDEYQKKINGWEEEKAEIEKRIERGY